MSSRFRLILTVLLVISSQSSFSENVSVELPSSSQKYLRKTHSTKQHTITILGAIAIISIGGMFWINTKKDSGTQASSGTPEQPSSPLPTRQNDTSRPAIPHLPTHSPLTITLSDPPPLEGTTPEIPQAFPFRNEEKVVCTHKKNCPGMVVSENPSRFHQYVEYDEKKSKELQKFLCHYAPPVKITEEIERYRKIQGEFIISENQDRNFSSDLTARGFIPLDTVIFKGYNLARVLYARRLSEIIKQFNLSCFAVAEKYAYPNPDEKSSTHNPVLVFAQKITPMKIPNEILNRKEFFPQLITLSKYSGLIDLGESNWFYNPAIGKVVLIDTNVLAGNQQEELINQLEDVAQFYCTTNENKQALKDAFDTAKRTIHKNNTVILTLRNDASRDPINCNWNLIHI